jgi:GNAT superfamily N-acetyltransferase
VSRARSEYHVRLDAALQPPPGPVTVVAATEAGPGALARLLLDAYRGTIDDDGEGEPEAQAAIEQYLARLVPDCSIVIEEDGTPVAMSFVVVVGDRHYIDPVVTAPARKGQGLGTAAVSHSLRELQHRGVDEVGAVITDGNLASERLFARLGFRRVGPWP